jgi:hypothetical protein
VARKYIVQPPYLNKQTSDLPSTINYSLQTFSKMRYGAPCASMRCVRRHAPSANSASYTSPVPVRLHSGMARFQRAFHATRAAA